MKPSHFAITTRQLLVALLVFGAATAVMANKTIEGLNGSWILDERASDNLEESSHALNNKLNAEWRERRENKFSRDQAKPKSRNRFQNQADSTERMIREDSRSRDWGGADEARAIMEAESIKLYQSRKVVVLYGGDWKRGLVVNAAGRAYSVSGTEITSDDLGHSLTFYDDNKLVIETDRHTGGKLVETYYLDGSPDRLVQAITVQERDGGPELEMVRYFDRTR